MRELAAVFSSMDMEGTGVIQFEQFKAAHSPSGIEPPRQKASVASVLGQLKMALAKNLNRVIDTFRDFDENHSGQLDKHQFRLALQKLGIVGRASAFDDTFDSIDTDRSGILEYHELKHHLARRHTGDPFIDLRRRTADPFLEFEEYQAALTRKAAGRKAREAAQRTLQAVDAKLDAASKAVALTAEQAEKAAAAEKAAVLSAERAATSAAVVKANKQAEKAKAEEAKFKKLQEAARLEMHREQAEALAEAQRHAKAMAAVAAAAAAAAAAEAEHKATVANGFVQLKMAVAKNLNRTIDTFREFDEDQSGTVDKREFRLGLQKLGIPGHEAAFDEIFDSIDRDRSGYLDYHELNRHLRRRSRDPSHTSAMGVLSRGGGAAGAVNGGAAGAVNGALRSAPSPQPALRVGGVRPCIGTFLAHHSAHLMQLFHEWDLGRRGALDKHKMRGNLLRVCTSLGWPASAASCNADLDELLKHLDLNGDGKITFAELKRGLNGFGRTGGEPPSWGLASSALASHGASQLAERGARHGAKPSSPKPRCQSAGRCQSPGRSSRSPGTAGSPIKLRWHDGVLVEKGSTPMLSALEYALGTALGGTAKQSGANPASGAGTRGEATRERERQKTAGAFSGLMREAARESAAAMREAEAVELRKQLDDAILQKQRAHECAWPGAHVPIPLAQVCAAWSEEEMLVEARRARLMGTLGGQGKPS